MKDAAPYSAPKEPGRWRSLTLAALVHALLLGFLWFGVRWQNETPVTVEAEVWSPQPREAAPRPQPEPTPREQPQPQPQPAPQAVKPEPKPQPEVKPEPKPEPRPDIALEQEKKRLEQERQQRREQAERDREEKLARQRIEEKRLAERRLEDKRRADQERAEKEAEKAEAARKLAAADAAKKAAAEKRRKQEAADAEMIAKAREQELRRISGGLTGSGGTGDAPRSQGGRADPSYTQRVGAKIKSNTIFAVPDDLANNPAVEYEVSLLPDGSLRAARKTKSSGIPAFDAAVLRAIERSQPYPPDKSGSVPSSLTISHKPKDQ